MGTFGFLVLFNLALCTLALRLNSHQLADSSCVNGDFFNGTCKCYPGATGSRCETILDCNFGTPTVDKNGLPACHCSVGFEPFSNCFKLACTDGKFEWLDIEGNLLQDPKCECRSGFRGRICTEIEFCEHGGQLNDSNSCICPPRTRGERCELVTCENGGTPVSALSLCLCPVWTTGDFCENLTGCQHGTLSDDGHCNCEQGYTGSACHIRNCINGDRVGDQCACHSLFTGDLCETLVKCSNATESGRQPPCNCTDGFSGPACEKFKCQNGGTPIVNNNGEVFCLCPTFTTGEFCQFELVCFNGGMFDPINRICQCADGYSGNLCDRIDCGSGHEIGELGSRDTMAYYCNISACDISNLPTSLDPICLDTCKTQCDCVFGYDPFDNCQSVSVCWYDGILIQDGNGKKSCQCKNGYHGRLCEYQNCAHGKRKVYEVGAIPASRCECDARYTGQTCDTILCYNGGTPNGDVCACPPHLSGVQCETIRLVRFFFIQKNYYTIMLKKIIIR